MGCFNVAGTMSNLTIGHGDKVAFFILCPSNRHYKEVDIKTPGTNLCSNEGACIVTKPFCPPIFGEYNDYGSVENIVKSQTTSDLEKYFGANIEDIITSLTRLQWGNDSPLESDLPDDVKESRMKEFSELSGMFEHEDVVRLMADYVRKENTVFKESHFTDEIMKLMGFEHKGTEVNELIKYSPTRYNNKWQKDNIVLYTDGKFIGDIAMVNDAPVSISHVYHPRDIANLVGISQWSDGMNKSCVSIEIEKYIKLKEEHAKALEEIEGPDDSDEQKAERKLRRMMARLTLRTERFPVVVDKEDFGSVEELELLHHFNNAMYSTNNFYFPAMSGEQHGNSEMDKALHDIRGNILFKQLNRDYE